MERPTSPNPDLRGRPCTALVASPIAAVLWAVPAAHSQTTVNGGTTVPVADPAAIGSGLDFLVGDGSQGTLQLLSAGTGEFTGTMTMNNAFGVFDLGGFSLTLLPTVPGGGAAVGNNRLGVVNGTLTLGAGSFLAGWGTLGGNQGVLRATDGGAFVVQDHLWLLNSTSLILEGAAGTRTLTYDDTEDVSFTGSLALNSTGPTSTVSTIAVGAGAGDLTLSGLVSGAGSLRITADDQDTTVILALTQAAPGSFTGSTILDGAAVRLDTQASVGDAGLTLIGADVTLGATLPNLAIGSGQTLTLSGANQFTGTGAGSTVDVAGTIDGLAGSSIELTDVTMNVADGATSTFAGGVTLGAGSGLGIANSGFLSGLGSLTFASAATVEYTDDAAVTYAGGLVLTDDATIRTSGALADTVILTLTGAVSGAGDLTLAATGGSSASFVLGLTGSFTGSTIVNDSDVTINSQGSVGTGGLQLNDLDASGLDAVVGANLTLADTQSLTIAGTVNLLSSVAGGASVNAQGGLLSAAAATLNLDEVSLTVGNGTASTFTGDITLTEGASLILDGADLSGVDVSSIVAGDAVTLGGIGTLGSIGSLADPFSGSIELGDLGVSASSVLVATGDAALAAAAILQSHFLESSGATGTADLLSVGGTFDAGGATASLVFDPDVFTGTWIPAPAETVTYTFVDAATGFTGTFGTVNVVTIDPITGAATTRPLDQSGETRFLGGAFNVIYTAAGGGPGAFQVSIRGIGGPPPLPAGGTTNTDVIVPVQVGSSIVERNANVGVVSNSQINASVDAMNALLLDPSASADSKFVATQLLLNDAPAYASAVTAVSAPTNPQALPTSLMLGTFDAGDVSMRRLMQLRPRGGSQASAGALATQDRRQRPWERGSAPSAVAPPVAVPRRQAFGPEIYGPTPDEGIRGWARGFGWTGSFKNQSWAQTSYDTVLGSAIAGADVSLGGGAIVGAFVGYVPGSVDITGGLVDESMTINGVDFGVYGSWSPGDGNWYLAGSGSGMWASVDRSRTLYVPGAVRTADSSSTAWTASLMGETGWNLWLGGDSYIDPYVRAAFGYFNQGSYTESGAGSMNLAVGDQQAYALQPSVGARFMHGIRSGGAVITPYVGGAFTAIVPIGDWDVTATNAFSSMPSMGVYGDPETQYGGSMEAGVEWALPSGFTFFAAFNGMFLSDVQVYGGSAGIVIPF
jgi:uncharacterized protein YhjY with autotransporter beta-barrel domain